MGYIIHAWRVFAVFLCYWGIHRYRVETFKLGGQTLTGRRCTRCYYEPMWDR